MPGKLRLGLVVLLVQALAGLGLGGLSLLQPEGTTAGAVLLVAGLVNALFAYAVFRGKEGARGLIVALSAVGMAGQLVLFAIAFPQLVRHTATDAGPPSVAAFVGAALNGLLIWSLTRRETKQWMAEKSMPGAEVDAI